MKTKSKLLLALSALTVGTVAAGATGTYAWFTASRNATMNITNITATNTRGNLNIGYFDLQASAPVTGNTTNTETLRSDTPLYDVSSRDGSTFYAPVWGTGDTPIGYKNTTEGYLTFGIVLSNQGTDPISCYFDSANSSITGTENEPLARWTKVAINAQAEGSQQPTSFGANDITQPGHFVFMENTNEDESGSLKKYITGTSTENTATYEEGDNFFTTVKGVDPMPTGNQNNEELACYLGDIQGTTGVNRLYVTVSIWMEGAIVQNQNDASGKMINIKLAFGALDADAGVGA